MKYILFGLSLTLLISCMAPVQQAETLSNTSLSAANFDTTIACKSIALYSITNANGIQLHLTNYGARIVALYTPDKHGEMADIVLGFDNIDDYLTDPMYLGCIVGRYANRIDQAKFSIEGKEFNLYKNEGENTLHGGKSGLDKKIWQAKQDGNTVTFTYLSPDGEEGYPGNLSISKSYTLTDKDELKIEYVAETDKATVINLSNHTYYNLKGEGDTTILDHYFVINADYFTPVDNEWIPTGELAPVAGTPFDFTKKKQIGQDLELDNEQLKNGLGYDHNWVLNKENPDSLSFAAQLSEKSSGRIIDIYTTEPGLQFYGGNFMDGTVSGKSGLPYKYRAALIFETQHFPDSPNHPNFPSTVLRPDEKYRHLAIYKFGIMNEEAMK